MELGRQYKKGSRDRSAVSRELGSVVLQAAAALDMNDLSEKKCLIEGVCELAVWGDPELAVRAIKTIENKEIRQNVAYMACACAIGICEQAPKAVHAILEGGFLEARDIAKILGYTEKLRDSRVKADPNGDTSAMTTIVAGIVPILADRRKFEAGQDKLSTAPAARAISPTELRCLTVRPNGPAPVVRGPNG